MIERLAGRQLVGVRQFVYRQARTSGNDKSLGVEHSDLLASNVLNNALLAQCRGDR
jgi:hypothetical protein